MSYAKNPVTNKIEILEENNYYPFGLKHQGYNIVTLQSNYKYKYNGKELQDELSLNLYDYGARNYDPALGRWMNIDPLAEKMRRFSPYNYTFNNPMRFTDPDGMAPNDWIKTGDSYRWDDRVTDQASAQKYHGDDAKYVGKEATVRSVQDGKTVDSVSLNSDGSVTKQGGTLSANSSEKFSNAAGSSFQPRQTEGSFASIGFDGALLGGFGVQVGVVSDAVGNSDFFINFNGNLGFGVSAGPSMGTISPTGDNQFVTSDFDGNSSSYSAGVSTPVYDASWGTGGTIDKNMSGVDKMSPSNFGRNQGEIQRGYKINQSGMGPGGSWGAGGIYSYGTTKTF